MLLKKDFEGGLRATLIQGQGQTHNLDSKIYLPGFHRFKFEFHSFFAETFSTASTRSGHRSDRNLASQQAAGLSPSSAPSLWVIMQGRRAFLFGLFPTADGRCRTGCCTPPHWFFAVSVFVSTGAATAPRWETTHGKLKNDRGSNRPVPDRACGRIAH